MAADIVRHRVEHRWSGLLVSVGTSQDAAASSSRAGQRAEQYGRHIHGHLQEGGPAGPLPRPHSQFPQSENHFLLREPRREMPSFFLSLFLFIAREYDGKSLS
jgi:hypothetical protein